MSEAGPSRRSEGAGSASLLPEGAEMGKTRQRVAEEPFSFQVHFLLKGHCLRSSSHLSCEECDSTTLT